MEKENYIDEGLKTKVLSFIVMGLMLITVWYMLNLVLMTFILAFVQYKFLNVIKKRLRKIIPERWKIHDGFILSVIYIVFVACIVILCAELVPVILSWIAELADQIIYFDNEAFMAALGPRLSKAMENLNFSSFIGNAGMMLTAKISDLSAKTGALAIDFFLATLLSFIILIEKEDIAAFGEKLAKSRISVIYEYITVFGGNFCRTFGSVMKVQVIIALINGLLSAAMLKLIGFSAILPLSVMIFSLGLIPVAGVAISLFPLSVIAFGIGGITKVLEVIVMVLLLHAIEAYILNPKLMAAKTRLPVCFVFAILLVGKHYLGVWGLLIGVPVFIFLMDVLDVRYDENGSEA